MIKSMTGFGRCESVKDNRKFTVEIKTVNHRYFDANIKLPKKFGFFESEIRAELKKYIQRGKADLFVTYEDTAAQTSVLHYNEALAEEYVQYFRRISERFQVPLDLTAEQIGFCPEVITMDEEDLDEEEIWSILKPAVEGACEQLSASREREGESLRADVLDKLTGMDENVTLIEERYPQIISGYRSRIEDKVKELLSDAQFDDSRIASEVVLYADKICTDEETVRLHSHIRSMQETLLAGGAVGRKLDFITQEMNREANTILSKANDLATSNIGIELKTDIEKVREQIQNIE